MIKLIFKILLLIAAFIAGYVLCYIGFLKDVADAIAELINSIFGYFMV